MKVFVTVVVVAGMLMAALVSGSWIELLVIKCAPYCVFGAVGAALVAARIRAGYFGLVLAGLGLLVFDAGVYLAVRYSPGSSTDAVAVVFVPMWQLVLVLPGMFLVGSLLRAVWPR